MFPNENFINAKSPLEKNDHPDEQITKCMCMIGQLQWAVALGRYDILAQVMSMSRFRLAPKIGHLEKMKIPKDIAKPLGKRIISTTFLDANLLHDIVTGKSVTTALHFVNTTPTDWFSERQATVDTATYGSEFCCQNCNRTNYEP